MRNLGVALLVVCLAAVAAHCDKVYYRAADGAWKSMEAAVKDGKLHIQIGLQAAPNGDAVIVINKPDWMVLDDTEAPSLSGLKVNGVARPSSTDALNLGCLTGNAAEVVFGVKDDKNPVAADTASLRLVDRPEVKLQVDTSGLGPPNSSGRLVVNVSGLAAGKYDGVLGLSDLAPLSNSRTWPVSFTVMGITVSADKQTVSLANATHGFTLQPSIGNQLLLPNGLWSKLTTHTGKDYLYPREFADVKIIKDTPEEQTVLVTAICQNLDGKPTDDQAKLEYELTVRPDTPALLVTTRSINVAAGDLTIGPNWGWLGCPYYFTPAGKASWSSGEGKERYSTIGKVGWLWLAPGKEGDPGLLWASADRFGEFMGGSILLYGNGRAVKPGEFVEMKLVFAVAATPGEAEAIYKDLVQKGLVTPPEEGG